MSHRLSITPRALKAMSKLPVTLRRRLDERITALTDEPRPPGCVKLSGQAGIWRIRVGDYRIVYAVHDEQAVVIVLLVAHRREVYRDL